jgi:non-specific serine/threonine protein kinase
MLGTTLLDRYRIDVRLGSGGMGTVYRAYDQRLERDVAIKILSNDDLGTQGRSRLLQEARAVAKLNHPNIVAVYDAQEEHGLSFIVMEFARGKTLRDKKPTALSEIIPITRQICSALDHAHNAGIIHRDLKPENIMLVGSRIKLMDFGLARSTKDDFFQDGAIVGTPAYIAPEQLKENWVDARSDLYSLGILLYELVTGRLPFQSTSFHSLILQHLQQAPVPPHEFNPELDAGFELLILKLLAKDPNDRYPSAQAVLEELNALYPSHSHAIGHSHPRHNLPAETTSFVGRQNETTQILDLLAKHRLVTLTGSGGIGKSRLSLHVASRLVETFPDGIWLVELAPISDPAMVTKEIVDMLNIREEPRRPLIETLSEALSNKTLLLILDNCEHLMDICAQLAEKLLHAAPGLKILDSSREALGIAGEMTYRVPSLSLPEAQIQQPEDLSHSEAVRLFVERAQAILPDFEITPQNAAALAQICRRLDGIPLALELAAARVNMLKIEQIATRLDDRFRLLTGGSRTALPRQQTLRAMIDWSWDLLSEPERCLLRYVSVFVDGWDLEAAEIVCGDLCTDPTHPIHADDIFDLLNQLVNKSLVLVEHDGQEEVRYCLLETIRQYAREKLMDSGAGPSVRDRHLNYFCKLAVKAEKEMYGPKQVSWHRRLVHELDNFRAALEWAQDSNVEAGLRIGAALNRFWTAYSMQDGIFWLQTLLDKPKDSVPPNVRAWGMVILGSLIMWQEDVTISRQYGQEALAIYRQLGDQEGEIAALQLLGFVGYYLEGEDKSREYLLESLRLSRLGKNKIGELEALGFLGFLPDNQDYATSRAYLEDSLTLCREIGHVLGMASRLDDLGRLALRYGDITLARSRFEEAIQLFSEAGMPNQMMLYRSLGELEMYEGNYELARHYTEISIDISRRQSAIWVNSWATLTLGYIYIRQGDSKTAWEIFTKSYRSFKERSISSGIVNSLEGIAILALNENQFEKACQLLAWADVTRIKNKDLHPALEQKYFDAKWDKICASLNPASLATACAVGEAMSLEEAAKLALDCA